MSVIYKDSILTLQTKYQVQNVSKFPKDRKYLIGTNVLLVSLSQSTAHVRAFDKMMEVPVRSLIKVNGFSAVGVKAQNADGFVVVSQNNLQIPVGTAYLNPTSVTETHAKFLISNKEVSIPLVICAALVEEKVKVSKTVKKKITKSEKESGIPSELVSVLDSPKEREDLSTLPEFLLKLFPLLNVEFIKDTLKDGEGVYADYEGNLHETIREADEANTIIRHELFENKLVKMVEEHTRNSFESGRLSELESR